MDKESKKYVVCGHYGATNLGDEAIGIGLIESIKSANHDHEITVMSYDKHRSDAFYKKYLPKISVKTAYLIPLGFRSLFRGLFQGELKKTKNEIKSCDRFILGGGGLFTDERLYAVFLWGLQALYSFRYKKPLYLIGHSVGPLDSRVGRWIVKKIFSRAEFISVRDESSKMLLQKLGIKKEIHVLCDMAMLINFDKKTPNKKLEQEGLKKYFILTFRNWDEKLNRLNKKLEHEVGRIIKDYSLQAILVPFQLFKENDQEFMNKKIVQSGGLEKIVVQRYQDDIFEILEKISGAEFVIGVRLHSLIFSSIVGTPFVGISYSQKVENFMSDLGLEDYCLKNNEFDADVLKNRIDNMIRESGHIREILTKKIPLMKERAQITLLKVLK